MQEAVVRKRYNPSGFGRSSGPCRVARSPLTAQCSSTHDDQRRAITIWWLRREPSNWLGHFTVTRPSSGYWKVCHLTSVFEWSVNRPEPGNGTRLRKFGGGIARANFRISHALAVHASSVQVQHDRASFVVRRGGEPQSQYSSRRGEDCHIYTRSNESKKLTGLRRRRPVPVLRLIPRISHWRPHGIAISCRQSDERSGNQREKRKPR